MDLVGQVVIVNRLAHANGFGASSKLGKPCKGMLQIRNRRDGNQVLVLSTRKESNAQSYDVKNIQVLRTQFVHDGFATIEIKEPPMNIMLRQCNPDLLKNFMEELLKLGKERKLTLTSTGSISRARSTSNLPGNENKEASQEKPGSSQKSGPVKRPRSPEFLNIEIQENPRPSLESCPLKRPKSPQHSKRESPEKPGSLRKSGPVKRPRSPELSKIQCSKIKKSLSASHQVMTVRKRQNYPNEIPCTMEKITVQGIGLRRLDAKYLKLKWLALLDLTGNQIKGIKELTKLSCNLSSLILAQNLIEDIPDDLFNAPPLQKLLHLDLSENQLTKMPLSVLNLHMLAHVNIRGNKVRYLPYNWMDMKSLRILNIRKNRLQFIPATIQHLQLSNLDMSDNPDLQSSQNMTPDYVGYSSLPTLFETACEVVMNTQRKNRTKLDELLLLPSVVQSYLQGGKYCFECNRLTLRYKIVKGTVLPNSFCTGPMSSCVVCPALAPCLVKKIICHACDSKLSVRRASRVNF